MLECADGLIPRDSGEVDEELVQRVPSLEVVDEGLKWNPRADEDRLASQDVGVGMHNRSPSHHRVTIQSHHRVTIQSMCE